MSDQEWYAAHSCQHAHCPEGCPKPQPSMVGGEMLCMRCLVLCGVRSKMIPCTPQTCDEAPQERP